MKVLIIDDHPVARRGLRMIVSEAFGEAHCAEAADAATALALAETLRPHLLLLDMHVTAFDSSGEIRDCLVAGADGCLLKDTSETDMAAALRATVTAAPALDPRIAFQLARNLAAGLTRAGHRLGAGQEGAG